MPAAIEGLGNLLGPLMARSVGVPTLITLRQRVVLATMVFAILMLTLLAAPALLGRELLTSFGVALVSFFMTPTLTLLGEHHQKMGKIAN